MTEQLWKEKQHTDSKAFPQEDSPLHKRCRKYQHDKEPDLKVHNSQAVGHFWERRICPVIYIG